MTRREVLEATQSAAYSPLLVHLRCVKRNARRAWRHTPDQGTPARGEAARTQAVWRQLRCADRDVEHEGRFDGCDARQMRQCVGEAARARRGLGGGGLACTEVGESK